MFFSRRKRPFTLFFVGCILFIASLAVLFVNEASQDFSTQIQDATAIDLMQTEKITTDNIIAGYGIVNSKETLGDKYLQNGPYLALERIVEVYAREEKQKSDAENIRYNYKKSWTTSPQDSRHFNRQEGHENNFRTADPYTRSVKKAKIGNYEIDMNKLTLPQLKTLQIRDNMLQENQNTTTQNNYIRIGSHNKLIPKIGDMRISYKTIESNQEMTVIGKMYRNKIQKHTNADGISYYGMFKGNKTNAITRTHQEYIKKLWLIRILGLVMMWFGLSVILGTRIKFIKELLSMIVGILRSATFIIALVLSVAVILLGKVIHNWVALLVVIVILIGIISYQKYHKKRNTRKMVNKQVARKAAKKVIRKKTKATSKGRKKK